MAAGGQHLQRPPSEKRVFHDFPYFWGFFLRFFWSGLADPFYVTCVVYAIRQNHRGARRLRRKEIVPDLNYVTDVSVPIFILFCI